MNAPETPAKKRPRWRFQYSLAALLSAVVFVNLGLAIYYSGEKYYRPCRTFRGHDEPVFFVGFQPGGQRVVSVGWDTARLWQLKDMRELENFPAFSSFVDNTTSCVALSPDGKHILMSDIGRSIRLRELSGREELHLRTKEGADRLTFSPDGRRALLVVPDDRRALPGAPGAIRLWRLENGATPQTFSGHAKEACFAIFSPDGDRMLSGSRDLTMRLWDLNNGATIRSFAHDSEVRAGAFSPDGKLALSGDAQGTIRLWDLESGVVLRRFAGASGKIRFVSFSPEGKHVVAVNDSEGIYVWSLLREKPIKKYQGKNTRVYGVDLSPDGKHLLVACGGEVHVWELYPDPWKFIGAIALTVAFAVFLIAMKIRARRRARTGGG